MSTLAKSELSLGEVAGLVGKFGSSRCQAVRTMPGGHQLHSLKELTEALDKRKEGICDDTKY